MCDDSSLKLSLYAAITAFAVAIALCTVAAFLNGSFWLAYLSPALMLLTAIASGIATIALMLAVYFARKYYECMLEGLTKEEMNRDLCSGEFQNFTRNIEALVLTAGILTTTAAGIALSAWIPWIPQPAMWSLIGAMVVTAILIASLFFFWRSFKVCIIDLRA
ncbi:MAG: hypothetical protein KAT46_01675 [Deltaproteobacteria bacterium]|nr:hypothetical protein [Deltaproteobacteria bacterium]